MDDEFRANSVLERYDGHIKDHLPRNPNWPKFLEFLKQEEADYVKFSIEAEQKGLMSEKSDNYGKTFLPNKLATINQI